MTFLIIINLIFFLLLILNLYKVRLKYRKTFYLYNGKNIGIEVSGFNSNFGIYLQVDGDEHEITIGLRCFLSVWITFGNFFSVSIYPKYKSSNYGYLNIQKEISITIHSNCLWWNLWTDDNHGFHISLREGCVDFERLLKGSYHAKEKLIQTIADNLFFIEGEYPILIHQIEQKIIYKRWFSKNRIVYRIKCGYINDKELFEVIPIPIPGKGENSWDQDEDCVYEIFIGFREIKTVEQAIKYFENSIARTRQNYGGINWKPKKKQK